MRVIIEQYVPYLHGVLEPYGEVQYLLPEAITPAVVRDADALIIRTRTKVNQALVEGSAVKLVATATIGCDHIDTAYLEEHGIRWFSCSGCNAQAVCDYVEEVLDELCGTALADTLHSLTMGIVGVGHVGSLVRQMAERKGLNVLLSDPPKGLYNEVTQADIITFHTPLTRDGQFPTYHLCDEQFLARCRPKALIINAARGGVVDEQALLTSGHDYVLDCWEGEPQVSQEVLAHARLASYHIAGYSVEGKRNASQMCLDALTTHFGLPQLTIKEDDGVRGDSAQGWLRRITETFKAQPDNFETLRKNYKLR